MTAAPPAAPRRATARPPLPRPVAWAAALLTARILLGLVGAADRLADGAPIRAAIQVTNPTLDAAEAARLYRLVLVLAVGYGLVYAAAYALLAVQLCRGRGWAVPAVRLVAGLGVLAGLGSLAGTAPFGRPLGVVLLLLDAATLGLLTIRPGWAARRGPEPVG